MMKKPPRGLTDKDMIKNYVEEKSVEAQLMTAAKKLPSLSLTRNFRAKD